MPGSFRTTGNATAATCTPKIVVRETYVVDEQLMACLVQVFHTREPRV